MLRDILEYYRKASSKDIDSIDKNNNPKLAAYSVNPVYEKLMSMPDEELKKHKLFCTFLSDDAAKWNALYKMCTGATANATLQGDGNGAAVDDALLSEVKESLNQSQQEALKIAINEPISLIQGPPGTGKTHMILALLYVLTRKLGKSVAVLSVNNEAIANITDEILENPTPKAYVGDLKEITAKLGNRDYRKEFNDSPNNTHGYVFAVDGDGYLEQNDEETIEEDFRRDYRIITSTPHSLMNLFSDSYEEQAMYDYVIVDETSQMNPMLGLIAMFAAKHLVLVGDDEQIPPIIDEDKYTDIHLAGRSDRIFMLEEDRSFLQVTSEVLKRHLKDVFGRDWIKKYDQITITLQKHYRCAAGIFDFCRENFYQDADLEIVGEKPSDNICPMRCIYYNGSFTERCYIGKTKWMKQKGIPVLNTVPCKDQNDPYYGAKQISEATSFSRKPNGEWKKEVSPRESSRNMRQIEIFLEEEWDSIVEDIINDPEYTVCILSPYKAQIYELQERIFRLKPESKDARATDEFPINSDWPLDAVLAKNTKNAPNEWGSFLTVLGADDDDTPGEDTQDDASADGSRNDQNFDISINSLIIRHSSKSLTIHSVQGQGFDRVYLLPVDDRPRSDQEKKPSFSQINHLVNVAVSRAKKEFCLIASTNLMTDEIRREFGIGPCADPADNSVTGKNADKNKKRYVDELIKYIYNAYYTDHKNGYFIKPDQKLKEKYGFHAEPLHTVFEIPDADVENWALNKGLQLLENNESGIEKMSKPEAKVDMFLELAAAKLGFSFDPVDLDASGQLKGISRQVHPENSDKFMDFAIRDNDGNVLCFVEEDGIAHRYRQNNDGSLKSDLKEYKDIQELIDFIRSCKRKDQLCEGLGIPLIRWNSDSSHMLSVDGETEDERSRRKRIIKEASGCFWDYNKSWREQIEKFYEFVELKMLLENR